MIYNHYRYKNTIVIYGFIEKKESYDLVLTLIQKNTIASAHGFLNRGIDNIHYSDLVSLWSYIKHNFKFKYLMIQILPKHYYFYKAVLPWVKIRNSKTCTGYESQTLTIDMSKELKKV